MHLRLHVSYKININAGGAGQINGFLFSLILWCVQFISFRKFAVHCKLCRFLVPFNYEIHYPSSSFNRRGQQRVARIYAHMYNIGYVDTM